MIWAVFAIMTGAAALCVLLPLARVRQARQIADADFYRSELAVIDRDVERGLITDADARATKTEAARRLLVADAAACQPAPSLWRRRVAALASIAIIGGVALGLYATIGNPNLPDQPLLARQSASPEQTDIMTAVAKIETHLAQNPDDGRGQEVIAPIYLRMGRYDDAVKAWASAIRILGSTPMRETSLGEAMVFAANGTVTPEARAAFERALTLAPDLQQARFYAGLAAVQDGDKEKARTIWSKLIAEAPPGAAWADIVRERIAGLDAPQDTPRAAQQADPRPSSEAGRNIAELPEADRNAAIRGMVDNLSARLAQNGHDSAGWAMLIRAYTALKEPTLARNAVNDARRALQDDTEARQRIDALARELNIEG
jgi:cytochrome c-type biogenesis protein CcmH